MKRSFAGATLNPFTNPAAKAPKARLTKAQEAKQLDETLAKFEAEIEAKTLEDSPKPALETKTQFVTRRTQELKEEVSPFRLDVVGTRKRLGAEYDAVALTKPVAKAPTATERMPTKAAESVQ